MIKDVYSQMVERVDKAREITGKPLTLSEKLLYALYLLGGLHDLIVCEIHSRGIVGVNLFIVHFLVLFFMGVITIIWGANDPFYGDLSVVIGVYSM